MLPLASTTSQDSDVAIGCGGLSAFAHGDERRAGAWLSAQVLADVVDFASTLAVRERLPPRGARFALLAAGVGVVVGSAAAFPLASR